MMGLGDLTKMLGQFKNIQANMQEAQEQLQNKTVQASSGGGMVTAKMNGKGELLDLKIDKTAVDVNDLEMLEDLVKAAVNAVRAKSQELMQEEMSKAMGGVNIAGLDKLSQML
ncbi:MAG: hypothetical protein AMJ79_07295 [Phycisphaerae bacterium SM23_30]|nr:MAG: hypothetical protein AMJ79_07295 [Phycisphaerae bacterium SM23_30]